MTPLVAVVGETASGKSALALEIAERYNGAIICADSRTVYKSMNIGTAKPSAEDQARVPHYMLDLVEPGQPFTVADFQTRCNITISDVENTGKLPILCGGSGLYIDSVIYNYQIPPAGDPAERVRLEALGIPELQAELHKKQIPLPENAKNKRYLIRTLERGGEPARRSVRGNTLVLGLTLLREVLAERIRARTTKMLADGVFDETRSLVERYGADCEQFKGSIYAAAVRHLAGEITRAELIEAVVASDLKLAKKQRTWFKRNKDIIWVSNAAEAHEAIDHFLANREK